MVQPEILLVKLLILFKFYIPRLGRDNFFAPWTWCTGTRVRAASAEPHKCSGYLGQWLPGAIRHALAVPYTLSTSKNKTYLKLKKYLHDHTLFGLS